MDEPGHGIVGRESELARVESFIGSVPEGPSALLLEGAAGIGKTTLWARGSVHGASARTSGAGLPPCHGSSTSSGFVRAQSSPDGSPPPTASRPRSPRPTPNPAGRFASEGFPRFLTAPEDLACSRTSTQPPGVEEVLDMEPKSATAQLPGQVWRRVVIVAAVVSAMVGGAVAVAERTMASEPGAGDLRLQATWVDPSCRELIALPKWGWVCVNHRP